jgi:hypothetical protein
MPIDKERGKWYNGIVAGEVLDYVGASVRETLQFSGIFKIGAYRP